MLPNTLQEIENWLLQHASQLANASLRPPATEAQLQELAQTIGRPLPDDFKQLYRWHDGLTDTQNEGSLFYGLDFWPLSQVISAHRSRLADEPPTPLFQADPQLDGTNLFNPAWVQFGSDWSRAGLFLDLAPTGAGTYGQILFIDPTYDAGFCIAASATELAEQFLADLTAGLYSLEPDALDDGYHFLSPASPIDLLNWHSSVRWQR